MRWLRRSGLELSLAGTQAVRALSDRPARTLLTLLGILIGVLALVVMMALVAGFSTALHESGTNLGVGVFQIQRDPAFGRQRRQKGPPRKAFTPADVAALRERLALTAAIGGEMWGGGKSFRTAQRKTNPVCMIAGGDPPFLVNNGYELETGRFLNDQDIRLLRKVVVLGADAASSLFAGGPDAALGSEVRLESVPFTVVGVLKGQAVLFGAAWRNCLAVVPVSAYQRAFGFTSMHLTFRRKEGVSLKEAEDEAVLAVRSMRGLKPNEPNDFEMFDNESAGQDIAGLTLLVGFAAGAICLIALLVGGVGVMNIMLVSVTERTREIGVRKALGARPGSIRRQFLVEAVLLSLSGGALGVVLAYGITRMVRDLSGLKAEVPLWAVGVALLTSTFVGLLAGVYPAARAARLDPIDALRYE